MSYMNQVTSEAQIPLLTEADLENTLEVKPSTVPAPDLNELADEISDADRLIEQANRAAHSYWFSMPNGEQLHLRHFLPQAPHAEEALDSARPTRVFMLHGEAETGRIYYDDTSKGLAWYLAKQGAEVFVLDLGGRGRSMAAPFDEEETEDSKPAHSTLSLDDIVIEVVGRAIKSMRRYSVFADQEQAVSDVWVGHGFACPVLAAAWAYADYDVSSMVFFASRRTLIPQTKLNKALSFVLRHPFTASLVEKLQIVPALKLGIGDANESCQWFQGYRRWLFSDNWTSDDGRIDYQSIIEHRRFPPTLHITTNAKDGLASYVDTRRFVDELGVHKAKLSVLDSHKNGFNHLSMLLSKEAETEVFTEVAEWLDENAMVISGSRVADNNKSDQDSQPLQSSGFDSTESTLSPVS